MKLKFVLPSVILILLCSSCAEICDTKKAPKPNSIRRLLGQSVNLAGANLSGADLRGSDLSRTDLRNANLRNAKLPSSEYLRDAKLQGAIMPDGTIHK